ncbi:hypothetical protein [Nocardioides sp. J54]|uniref:hypothetical protein n=1 Tax=Nocardioides sp. J54 TaxID=935866 RepID=UPI00048FDA51|nr:hypothetical protein [Nocardioides sp. J54]
MKDLRRVVVTLVIGSFSLAALLGIAALLGGGEFTETQGRVLLTTVVVGVESTVVLCLLALAGHRFFPVSVVGGLASVVATGAALTLTWADFAWDSGAWDTLWKTFGVSGVVAGTGAQLALLVALTLRPGRAAGTLGLLLAGTAAAAAVVATMVVVPILGESDPGGTYWRTFGVLAILDVLGSVVLTALGAFGRARVPRPTDAAATPAEPLALTPDLQERVASYARSRGTTPERVLAAAVDRYLAAS